MQHQHCVCTLKACLVVGMDPKLLVPFSDTVKAWFQQLKAGGKQSTPSNYDVEQAAADSILTLPANLPQIGRQTSSQRAKSWSEKIVRRYIAKDKKRPTNANGKVSKKNKKKKKKAAKKESTKKKSLKRKINDLGKGLGSSSSSSSSSSMNTRYAKRARSSQTEL